MEKSLDQERSSKVRHLEIVPLDQIPDVAKMDYYIAVLKEHISDYIDCNEEYLELNLMYEKICELELWWETWYDLER